MKPTEHEGAAVQEVVADRVLVVEDSRAIVSVLGFRVDIAPSAREAITLLERHAPRYVCAILDLGLPDCEEGKIVPKVLAYGVPPLVLTGTLDEQVRREILRYPVVDYVLKNNVHDLDYVVGLIRRLSRNVQIKVLVVDDMRSSRMFVYRLLEAHRYRLLQASNGEEALRVIAGNPDLRLVITDFQMPVMDGVELTMRIRQRYSRDRLAIIGVSAQGSSALSARFLKAGANDYLTKPFLVEEFYCRVNQNMDYQERLQEIAESANRDWLTGLHNRRYLFEVGKALHANALRGNLALTAVLVDIDHFKKVNDRYGHDAGDAALVHVSRLLESEVRETDLVVRYGGEEFCILLANCAYDDCLQVVERMRQRIAGGPFRYGSQEIPLTASFGVSCTLGDRLESMLSVADQLLYRAKKEGRNRVITECSA